MIDPTGMAAEECKGCPEPKDGDPGAGTGYGGVTVTASRIFDLPDFSSVQKSNQNAQAGWGGGGNSGGSGEYKSPNIEAANRYFNPNRPPSSGAISPDYTIEGITFPVFRILKAVKIPGIQSLFRGIYTKSSLNLLGQPINQGVKQLEWIMAKHGPNQLSKYAGKSQFYISTQAELQALIRGATHMPVTVQPGGNILRSVDAGRIIGFDAISGKPTSIYSVITNPNGNLITAFPGLSKF
jgi:hypothetical protein